MFRFAVLFACLAACSSHAVLPVVPAAHSLHPIPLVVPYPLYHGYAGHGLYGGVVAKPLAHHLLKRSPHFVAPLAHVAPVAVSHQSRVDVHSSPAVIAPVLPIIKPVVAPVIATPLLHKPLIAAPYYGAGLYGAGHYGAGLFGAGHYGAGYYGAGHYGGI